MQPDDDQAVLNREVASPGFAPICRPPNPPSATPEATETEFLGRKQGKVANHSEKCGNDRGATMTYRLAKSNILSYLNALEARRPLIGIQEVAKREAAQATRNFVRKFAEGATLHGD